MPDDPIKVEGTYTVTDGSDVFLTVIIGQGQLGSSSVFLDNDAIVHAGSNIGQLRLGNGENLRGKTLGVDSILHDVSKMNDKLTVLYVLAGGPQQQTFSGEGDAPEAGGALFFEALIDLV